MMKRLGLIARADKTGLGYQTKSYYDWLKPQETLLVDISEVTKTEQHYGWYPNAYISKGFPTKEILVNFLSKVDVVLTAETPYNFELYTLAKSMGVKVICAENPEFYDHIVKPQLPTPDAIILPSVWLEEYIRNDAEPKGIKVFQIHHPVDRSVFKFRLRNGQNKSFHVAGKHASHDRNGTMYYMQAVPEGKIITQTRDLARLIRQQYPRSQVYESLTDPTYLYELGDLLVLPRRYGGNCLPLNEALSCGVPVIMPDISPNNNLLPKDWLVPATTTTAFYPRGKVDIYDINPLDLQHKIIYMLKDLPTHSKLANEIADTISWETLKDSYMKVIEEI